MNASMLRSFPLRLAALLSFLAPVGCEFFSDTPALVPEAAPTDQVGDGGPRALWVDLYYPGWTQDRLPPEALDLTGITHVIHFAWIPWIGEGGTDIVIDDQQNGVGADEAAALLKIAHDAGKKVLISVGGSGSGSQYFNKAMSDASRAEFIQAIVSKTVERGYDGIDIDWEPAWEDTQSFIPLFQQFSRELRAAVNATAPNLLLTAAGLGASAGTYGLIAGVYDQVNIMTYDLVYGVPLTWHDSALMGGSGAYYSADRAVTEYGLAGTATSRIGIGLKCSGFSWANATAPMQSAMGAMPRSVPYASIMATNYSDDTYRWDDIARVPYLSIATPTPTFITYDDPRSAKAKIDYIKAGHLGGLIIWDPSEQYFPNGDPAGSKHPLIQAVAQAVASP